MIRELFSIVIDAISSRVGVTENCRSSLSTSKKNKSNDNSVPSESSRIV